MDELMKLRERIDWLDTQIASLLNERMKAADQVGKIKRINHQEVTDQSREKNILDKVETIIQHPILKTTIANIYREIMQESRIAQQFFQALSQPFRRIGIIGMGLMGGSICKGIKTKDSSVEIGTLCHASEDISLAYEGGWIDHVYPTMGELMQNSEIVILASPMSTVIPFAEEIKLHSVNLEKLIVIDIASVKGDIIDTFESLSCEKIEYITTHPMAGKETNGFLNSQPTLFVNRPWIIVPHQKNCSTLLESIQTLIRFLGAEPICLTAKVHDQQAALVSHLPTLLAKSYFDFVNSIDPDCLKISGPGFQSFTRLAHDQGERRSDMMKYNQQTIQGYLEQWLAYLIKNKRILK
jgi:prephenate dehydrogenase/chorismate mutase